MVVESCRSGCRDLPGQPVSYDFLDSAHVLGKNIIEFRMFPILRVLGALSCHYIVRCSDAQSKATTI